MGQGKGQGKGKGKGKPAVVFNDMTADGLMELVTDGNGMDPFEGHDLYERLGFWLGLWAPIWFFIFYSFKQLRFLWIWFTLI